jgi:site-specific DNA-methyltransferase (adenine-specific)
MEYMKDCEDNAFDLAIVDPPYGIGSYWMKQKHTRHYGDPGWNEKPPGQEYFAELFRISENQIIWGGNYFTEYLPVRNIWIFWDKGNDVLKTNTSEGELAWTSFNLAMRKVFVQWSGGRKGKETDIKCIHPCQRPIGLHDWLLKNYAEPGQRIIDTHLGSGSSAIAAHYFGCDFTGLEIDKDYFKAASARFKKATAQIAMF